MSALGAARFLYPLCFIHYLHRWALQASYCFICNTKQKKSCTLIKMNSIRHHLNKHIFMYSKCNRIASTRITSITFSTLLVYIFKNTNANITIKKKLKQPYSHLLWWPIQVLFLINRISYGNKIWRKIFYIKKCWACAHKSAHQLSPVSCKPRSLQDTLS